jgi:polyisoprenoid-binding protein YceI
MRIKSIAGIGITVLAAALALGLAPQAEKPAPKDEASKSMKFSVDDVHSSLIFKIEHMGLCHFYGRFNDLDGHYTLDTANPEASAFDIKVKVNSVDTASENRDKHLKSPDFFNAAEFEHISFKSTKVSKSADNTLQVTGDLTLHGVTKPITVNMTVNGPKDFEGKFKSGIETTFTINRADFELGSAGGLGDEVTIMLAIEGRKT